MNNKVSFNKVKQRSSLKKIFIAAAIGGTIVASPFITFKVEQSLVIQDLTQSKRATIGNNTALTTSIIDCIIEKSVPRQSSAVVYDRWSRRVSLINPISNYFSEKAVNEYTLGTMDGSACILNQMANEIEAQKFGASKKLATIRPNKN